MNRFYKHVLYVMMFILSSSFVFGQNGHVPGKERGDASKRAKGQMEGNKIRTTIHNFLFTGRTGGEFPISVQTPYEWPKNTGKVYLALTGLFAGGEVTDNNGEVQKIVVAPNYKTSPEGKSWNFEPAPGYYNDLRSERTIATSVDETTWPEFWPDRLNDELDPGWKNSWNGYFGKNRFNADQEMFYRASDDGYDRYVNYFPDTTDLSRKGLGLVVDVRALTWSQVLVEDVMYVLHTIKNDGTKDIDKFAVSLWFADFVGGNGDSQDDVSEFDLIEDILWARDTDHRAPDFGSDPVGIVAVTLLETPGNAVDRIDNDGDSPENGPLVTQEMLAGEIADNLIDDNANGLVDENETHIPFGTQTGVTYADGIAQVVNTAWSSTSYNFKVEKNSPLVTQAMIDVANNNTWKLWPPLDDFQNGQVHLIGVESDDLGMAFKDYIDNDEDGEENSPVITQNMITQAAQDAPYFRYRVNSNIILYNVLQNTLGKKYADGIDNDNNGAIDEGIDDGIDVLIDERRDDGIDNDYDWNPVTDDVGLDGVSDTGDDGENDGKPSSGARFGLPGEPSVDVTDVSETDVIGITNAQKTGAEGVPNSDAVFWFKFMIPGKFFSPFPVLTGEYDLWVSSGFFPLKAGQSEPISMAVLLANGPVPDPDGQFRKNEILRKRVRAQETYNNDYQFANAPLTPTVTAVAGDNKVTLYWDDIAESSFDSYINNIGGIGDDFEGYRIYRSSDPAFEDAEQITNGYGNVQFKLPIAIFDKEDGIFGFDPVGIDGVKYQLSWDVTKESGLQHSFIDSTVKNGFTYYYAVTSFDFGYSAGQIIPSESPIRISLQADGSVKLGSNVVKVKPEAPVAGYNAATLGNINLIEGTTTGRIDYSILDESKIMNGHVYHITFEDTLKVGSSSTKPDTLTTKSFTLTDSTSNVVLIDKSRNLSALYEQPIIDGFRLRLVNEVRVELNKSLSVWSNNNVPDFVFEKFVAGALAGTERPSDYEIVFGEVGKGRSSEIKIGNNTFPAVDVNFTVYNISEDRFIEFGFIEVDNAGGAGKLSAKGALKDRIVFLEPDATGKLVFTWWFYLNKEANANLGQTIPQPNDVATIKLKKPFLKADKFRFVAVGAKEDSESAKAEMDKIKVVPNPYLASASWEQKNPFSTGRGPRELHFTHLPAKCTIRIFTVNGELVDIIEHNNPLNDGTAVWNMLSRDNLSISYGVYVFHVEAPGIGEKIGKFAVIK